MLSARILFAVLLVVALMVAGQLMFKATAIAWQAEGTWYSAKVLARLLPSLAIYAFVTLAWIWVLQHVALGRAYPFMALAFVFVPILSGWFFGEQYGWRYYIGVLLICGGVIIATSAPSLGSDNSDVPKGS